VSKRRDLEATLKSFGEIRDILNAMKNMARMEAHRLGRFLETQRRVVASIESAAADFRQFYPSLFLSGEGAREVCVLLGSERGFCGDFNESLLRTLDAQNVRKPNVSLVVVGSKLRAKIGEAFGEAAFLESASVVDEVEGVLIKLMDALSGLEERPQDGAAPLRLTVFHHHAHGEDVRVSVLYPFEEARPPATAFAYAPYLLLEPVSFLSGLVEQYLFARLHELLYSSLMAENQARIEHMESAVQRLERKSTELLRRRNVLRQEEITEEIEVIMLSAETIGTS
jgi:F-type H+-transporting ATPase subunit gamma